MKAKTVSPKLLIVVFVASSLLGQAKFQQDPTLRCGLPDNVPRITTTFHIDLWWPNPLSNEWVLGPVFGGCANSNDHVFVVQRTEKGLERPVPGRGGNKHGPPVLEFDRAGNLVKSWGDLFLVAANRGIEKFRAVGKD